jgi:excisionase family DNA binding protein
MPDVLTVPEVSERLNVAEPTVRAMLRRGTLRGFIDGRLIRVTRESVEALVSGRSPAESAT